MSDDTELVKRLRDSGPFPNSEGCMSLQVPSWHDAHEAADRIAELTTEVERLTQAGEALYELRAESKQIPPPDHLSVGRLVIGPDGDAQPILGVCRPASWSKGWQVLIWSWSYGFAVLDDDKVEVVDGGDR
jgi:hypothetical protein